MPLCNDLLANNLYDEISVVVVAQLMLKGLKESLK